MKNLADLFPITTLKHCFPAASSASISSRGISIGCRDRFLGLDITEKTYITSWQDNGQFEFSRSIFVKNSLNAF